MIESDNQRSGLPDTMSRAISTREEFSVQRGLGFLVQHWLAVGACVIVFAGLAIAASFLLPRTYRGEVQTTVNSSQQGLGPLAAMAGSFGLMASLASLALPGSANQAEQIVARLTSRGFIEDFIKDEGLQSQLLPTKRSGSSGDDEADSLEDAYKAFKRRVLRARVDKRTGIVVIQVRWRDPKVAADWANELVARVNQVVRARAIAESRKTIEYLKRELDAAEAVELRRSIGMLMESELNKQMIATTRLDFALIVLDAARPSDPENYASPKHWAFGIMGAFFGFCVGVLLCMYRDLAAARKLAQRV